MSKSDMLQSTQSSEGTKELARKEVIQLLNLNTNINSTEDLLEEIQKIRNRTNKEANQCKSILNSLIQTITEEARKSINLVGKANKTTDRLKVLFRDIEKLCRDSSDLENREFIAKVSCANFNVGKTVENVEDVLEIPSLAAEAQQLIAEGVDLVQGYLSLVELEGASLIAKKAVLKDQSESANGSHQSLSEYFDKVQDANKKFEETLWSTFRNFIAVGRTKPDVLLSAVKVVEIQELRDEGLVDIKADMQNLRQWRKKCKEEISRGIQNSTEALSKLCQMLGESLQESHTQIISIDEVLEVANSIAADFTDIYDFSAPCFPESYDIFQFMMKCYHDGFGGMIDSIGKFADILSNKQILSVFTWITQYLSYLESLGIEVTSEYEKWTFGEIPQNDGENDIVEEDDKKGILSLDAFLSPAPAKSECVTAEIDDDKKPGVKGVNILTRTYIMRMREYLSSWFVNIIEAETKQMAEPKEDENGKLWTPALIDLFRILNQQVTIVQKSTTGVMLLEISRTIIHVMIEFQEIEMKRLQESSEEMTLEMTIAAVNTNLKAYDMSLELADHIDGNLDPIYRGIVDIEDACRGFLQVSKHAVDVVALCIIHDEGISDMFQNKMFGGEWCDGQITNVILATLEDYMQDVQRWIEKSFCHRVAESLMNKTVEIWINTFMENTPVIQEDVTDQIGRDCYSLQDFFEKYSKPQKGNKLNSFQVMESLSDLVSADSIDGFAISYRLLIEVKSDFKPSLIDKILHAREDISKRDKTKIMLQCEEIWAERKQSNMKSVVNSYRFLKYVSKEQNSN